MKSKNQLLRVILFFTALFGFVSCDVEPLDAGLDNPNNPDLDANFSVYFGSTFYSTDDVIATVEAGTLVIEAENELGIFELNVQGATVGSYTNSQALFHYKETETSDEYYSVNPLTGVSNSELRITSVNYTNQTITGTFFFTGYKLVIDGVNFTVQERVFSQGVFVNIPYGGGMIVNPEDPEPSTGDYFPMAIGNTWNYDVSNEDEDSQIKINSTETINGNLYYKVTDLPIGVGVDVPEGEFPGLDVRSHLRKNGSNYIQRFYAFIPEMMGGLIPQTEIETFEIIFLKDNLAVGESWTENKSIVTNVLLFGMPQTITANATFHSVIEEKGGVLVVNGVTYNDVIKVKTTATVVSDDGTEVSASENWFAKDIGLIRSYSNDPEEGESDMTLLNYQLN